MLQMLQMLQKLTVAAVLLFCLSSAIGHKYSHLTGSFGEQKIPLDIKFDDNVMVVTTHAPSNAPDSFRETANLHIFPTRTVAIRNWMDKICYIQRFNATQDEMKERVQNAIMHGGDLGYVKEERVSLKGLRPLLQRSVKKILGEEIAEFCNMHKVYILGHSNYQLIHPQDVDSPIRERRFAAMPRFDRVWRGDIVGNGWGSPQWRWRDRDYRNIFVVC